tara:strand:+ start:9617 stop:11407 length:1791 start_codon:yes stop_codon:yes gene_type:complete
MSSIVSAFDENLKPKRIGEKGHIEYDWSLKPKELITQFFFQLVRTEDTSDLQKKLIFLLDNLNWEDNEKELSILYKLISQTRDMVAGKGDMDNTWFQIEIWHRYYPDLAYNAFLHCVDYSHSCLNGHQYGSFKDIKYFLAYLNENTIEKQAHPLVEKILTNIAMKWLKRDEKLFNENKPVSLCGKWIPREKSSKRFNWIFKKLANIMFPDFVIAPENGWRDHEQMKKAQLKQKIHLKKLIVKLSGSNGGSDTTQVKMAGKDWKNIDFNKVTSITLRKQKNAFLNKTKTASVKWHLEDRCQCAENYKQHITKALSGDKTAKVHGKRLNVGELAKDAYSYNESNDDDNTIRETINLQWKSNGENNKGLENMCIIPMCDTSGSMECDNCIPLNNAIGLSLRISEICHPDFRHRLLTFDAYPQWINTEDCKDFVEKAKKVRRSAWGCNTDFHLACDKMCESLVENNIDPKEVKNLVLAVFSDMQFDCEYHNVGIFDTAYDKIIQKFYDAGMKTKYKKPYDPPHILFWNLRKTKGFPATTFTKNITFLSGYSSSLLNVFVTKGLNELRKTTPFSLLDNLLNIDRYRAMDENISDYLSYIEI